MPHAVFRPRTRLPLTWYSLSLPTTAKGMTSCKTEREREMRKRQRWVERVIKERETKGERREIDRRESD